MTDTTHDVVVTGGSAGGIATAVRAAREGCDVLLVTYNQNLGGMMAGGLSYTDTLTTKARTPLLEEFVDQVLTHYEEEYGPDSEQVEYSEDGYIFEPHVAESIFEAFVDAEPSLSVRRGYYPASVERSGRSVDAVTFAPFDDAEAQFVAAADTFVEATYEGDLMAAAGTDYRVGRESRGEYDEQFAGRLYTQVRGDRYYPRAAVGHEDESALADRRGPLHVPEEQQQGELDLRPHPAGLTEIYPKSTGEGDDAIQAYNYRLCLSRDPENRRYPEKPPTYDREEFLEPLERIDESGLRPYLLLRYLPNDKADMNTADLPGTNHDYPEADWERRHEIAERHRNYALGLLYFLHNDGAVPDDVQEAAREWGLAKDEFTDNDNFPWQLYVREARRLEGRVTFTENDARHAPGLDRTPINEDSIAIAEYPLDSHACHEDRQLGSMPEGFFYASQVTRPSQVPYRALLPQDIDNLLVTVPLSSTHVAYGTIRLEPTWLHIGEAAGVAAALAIDTATDPADLAWDNLQSALAESGVMLSFFNEFDMATDASWVAPIQYLGTKGFFTSYDAQPEEPIDGDVATVWARRTAALAADDASDATKFARRLEKLEVEASSGPIDSDEFNTLLEDAFEGRDLDTSVVDVRGSSTLTRGDACNIIYDLLHSDYSAH